MIEDSTRAERFRQIYSAHYDDLWRYCLRRTPSADEAEDVLADVLMVGWRKLDEMPTGDDARPWLFAVARNHIRNRWRQSDRSRTLHLRLVSDVVTSAGGEPPEPAEPDAVADVRSALARLSESDAEVLRLAVWEELSHREISRVMGCSENAATIRIHRARLRLADQLQTIQRTDPQSTTPSKGEPHE